MIRILHCADFHLDSSFAAIGFPNTVARKYREALREVLVRIVDLALERKVDAITIAGDLYEQERFTRDTGEFLRGQFERAAPVRVFVAPGNHDPWMPESLYQYLTWPQNVTLFQTSEFSPADLAPGIKLWGMAHLSLADKRNPVAGFKAPGPGRHILLFHGSDLSSIPAGQKAHAPFDLEDLAATGAHLVLLGHYHGARLGEEAGFKYVYPGSPEPLGFRETGEHTAALISIDEDTLDIATIPTSRYRFVQLRVDVSGLPTREEIKNRIEQEVADHGGDTTFLRVELEGQLPPETELDLAILQEHINSFCVHGQLLDRTRPTYDFERIAREKTVRGEYVRKIHEMLKDADEEERVKLRQALVYGLNAFERHEIFPASQS
jgi:DNA repair exonuclease SbcCD nuclease subunit